MNLFIVFLIKPTNIENDFGVKQVIAKNSKNFSETNHNSWLGHFFHAVRLVVN